jgi:hypothetical protein
MDARRTWPCIMCGAPATYQVQVTADAMPPRLLLDAPVVCDVHAGQARRMTMNRGYRPDQIALVALPNESAAAA